MTAKYHIRRKMIYKGYVYLLSIVDGSKAMWSVHKYDGDTNIPTDVLATLFQRDHDIQIDGFLKQELEQEPQEFKVQTVEEVKAPDIEKLRD